MEKILIEPKDPKQRIVRVVHADYVRDFSAEKPPFEATPEEWNAHLFRTGLFREAQSAKGEEPSVARPKGANHAG